MKTVKLMGGLGNQMFQYAFGVLLNGRVVYDISWFDKIKNNSDATQRDYELDFWNINPVTVSKPKKKIFGIFKIKNIKENPCNVYNPKLLKERNGIFEGYFQVAKYYDGIREQLLKDFVPRNKPNVFNQKILKLIKKTNSISIHVRRGDYVKLQHIHGLCDLNYYNRAINFIAENVKDPYFYVFSDDMQWVKDNLKIDFPCEYIDFNHGRDSAWDIWLMANCKHNIIANSSFSWWGAWLNQNPDKIIIAPKVWSVKAVKTDIIPEQWKEM